MSVRADIATRVPARSEFLIGSSFIARIADLTVTIPVVLLVAALTNSYAWAGAAAGALALGAAIATPVLGRLADARGHRRVLGAAAVVSGLFLAALALVPSGAGPLALVALSAGAGLASPPLEASVRSLVAARESDTRRQRLLTIDTTAEEVVFIAAPPVLIGVAALVSPSASVLACAVALVGGTALMLASPASAGRGHGAEGVGSPLAEPVVGLLALVGLLVGVFYGATELALVARADELGAPILAAAMISFWAGGSFVGGVVAATRPWRRAAGPRLVVLLGIAAIAAVPIAFAAGSTLTLGVALALQGLTIAPAAAAHAELTGDAAPVGTGTEAFAWSTSAMALGVAGGHAGAGIVVDAASAPAALFLGSVFMVLAAVVAVVAVRRWQGERSPLAPSAPG